MINNITNLYYGAITPSVYNLLETIPNEKLYHNEHCLRHPSSIYTISKGKVIKAFNSLLDILDEMSSVHSDRFGIYEEKLDESYTHLLEAMVSYVDDTYNILKCLYPKSKVSKNEPFAYKWLLAADENIISEYQTSIHQYRKKIAYINNKIKHEHGLFSHICAITTWARVAGFYLEAINKDGVIVPYNKVHEMYNNKHTGISYNKDILDQLVSFYIISNKLETTINKILLSNYNMVIDYSKDNSDEYSEFNMLLIRVNKVPKVYYENEYSSVYKIELGCDKVKIIQGIPSRYMTMPTYLSWRFIHTPDRKSRTVTLPYYEGIDD